LGDVREGRNPYPKIEIRGLAGEGQGEETFRWRGRKTVGRKVAGTAILAATGPVDYIFLSDIFPSILSSMFLYWAKEKVVSYRPRPIAIAMSFFMV